MAKKKNMHLAKKGAIGLARKREELRKLLDKAKSVGLTRAQKEQAMRLVASINKSKAMIVSAGYDPNMAAAGARTLTKNSLKRTKIRRKASCGGAGMYNLGASTKHWK